MWTLTGSFDGLLREGVNGRSLIRNRRIEVVVDNLNVLVLLLEGHNLMGNGLSHGEAGDIFSNTREAHNDVLRMRPAKLSLALLSKNTEVGLRVGLQLSTDSLGQAGVHTSTKTLIRGGNNEKSLSLLLRLGLGLLIDLVVGRTVHPSLDHVALSLVHLRGGDNLHGLGDLFDVTDGLETAFDFTEGGIVVGGSRSAQWMISVSGSAGKVEVGGERCPRAAHLADTAAAL